LSVAAVLVPGASAISVSCSEKPLTPLGYGVTAVHADQVQVPASTPPIAVLDTGVAGVAELTGRVRAGYNVTNGSANTNDIDGHGTAVASIAAAAAGGVRGISPTSPVIPIKVFDDRGQSAPEDLIAAIQRAISLKAGVINISASALPSDIDPADGKRLKYAINAAVSLGIPVIAASGNEGAGTLDIPAAYPHVIAVCATDSQGGPASFSNSGGGLDLVAPGEEIAVAAPPNLCSTGYATVTGTSFAAPAVAGAAALLLAKNPDLDAGQVADMLRLRGVRSPAPDWTLETGFGLLDVAASVNGPVPSADQPEVNDDIGWAKLQPAVLSGSKKSRAVFARIAPHIDPVDVYRMKLKKGDRLRAALKAPSGVKLRLSFGKKSLARKKGSRFETRIRAAGTYFVGVSIQKSPDAGTGYSLALSR
jgi:subtilisin family serine protease